MSEQTIYKCNTWTKAMDESFFHISVNTAFHALIEPEHIG